jgi:hypothetical protein
MSDKTYIELNKNNKSTIQINVYDRATGQPFYPSGAYYIVKGTRKDNTIISRSAAKVHQNHVWTTITQTITASAAEYDIIWEIHRTDGDITNHCTKVLVVDSC